MTPDKRRALAEEIKEYLVKYASIKIHHKDDYGGHVAFMDADEFQEMHHLLFRASEILPIIEAVKIEAKKECVEWTDGCYSHTEANLKKLFGADHYINRPHKEQPCVPCWCRFVLEKEDEE